MTTSKAIETAIECAPRGTYGLLCEPWTPGEVYGVAANWAQASCTVLTYGEDGWVATGHQVADYRHNDRAALIDVLAEQLRMGGDDEEEAEKEAESLVDDAINFPAEGD
jgi:hypothetical protein